MIVFLPSSIIHYLLGLNVIYCFVLFRLIHFFLDARSIVNYVLKRNVEIYIDKTFEKVKFAYCMIYVTTGSVHRGHGYTPYDTPESS